MRVVVDGDAVFIAADDFVDLQVSDVTWVDVPEAELRDYRRRDLEHARYREVVLDRMRPSLLRILVLAALAVFWGCAVFVVLWWLTCAG